MKLSILILLSICSWLSLSSSSAFAGPVEDCDRLAADPEVSSSGIALEAIDGETAKAACAAAFHARPETARFAHEYARALERTGDLDAAKRLYSRAADDGFAASSRALARLGPAPSPESSALGNTSQAQADDPIRAFLRATGTDLVALTSAIRGNFGLELY